MGLNQMSRRGDAFPDPTEGLNLEALRTNAPIVYGAGSAGRVLLRLLEEAGIAVRCCIDKNAAVIGAVGRVPVHPPEYLSTVVNLGLRVVIVSVNSEHAFNSICDELLWRFPALSKPVWGRSLIDAYAVRRCKDRLSNGQGLDLRDCMGCRADPSGCEAFRLGAQSVAAPHLPAVTSTSRINDFAYFVTNHCTLNCEHCVESLPYYDRYLTETAANILTRVRRVVEVSGVINRFSITGGEALLNKELPEILSGLLDMPGIGYIYLYTSGTVVPKSDLASILANRRIAVNVSDYGFHVQGKLRANLDKFIAVLEAYKVNYRLLSNKAWFDLGRFEFLNLDADALRTSFSNCAFTNCMTISDGVLYRCPHQLAGMQQGLLSSVEGETVNLDRLSGEQLVQALDHFVGLEFINACAHCMLSSTAREVPAAKQIPRRIMMRQVPV